MDKKINKVQLPSLKLGIIGLVMMFAGFIFGSTCFTIGVALMATGVTTQTIQAIIDRGEKKNE